MSIGLAGQKIITHGLGINHKACDGIITTHFSLYCQDVEVPPTGGGGGPYPGKAWNKFDNAWDIFKPVDKDHYDPDKIYKVKKQVILKMRMGDVEIEKIFLVPINRTKIVVKVLSIVERGYKKVAVAVGGVKRVYHRIGVSITNFKKKK